ncbi:MAG: hypothetical protein RIE52_11870 [Balneola sp.]
MSNPGLLAVSFYKTSDGTTYQIDGANVATDSEGYKKTALKLNATKGNERVKNYEHRFSVRHNDSTFHSNFTGDADFSNRSWRIAWVEFGAFGKWNEDSRVIIDSEKIEVDPESEDVFPYTLTVRVISNSANIYRGKNLHYVNARTNGRDSAWQDSNADNLADGYTEVGTITSKTFASGSQTIEGSTGSIAIQKVMVFPVSGIELTSSFDWQTISAYTNNQRLTYRSFAGASLDSNQSNVSGIGVNGHSLTSPSNTYDILVQYLRVDSIGGATSVSGKDPAIRLNESEVYVDY